MNITSPFWFIGRFFIKDEWKYWNPILFNSVRQPRWFYKIRIKYRKLSQSDIDLFNELNS
jgi:hypothetical protein